MFQTLVSIQESLKKIHPARSASLLSINKNLIKLFLELVIACHSANPLMLLSWYKYILSSFAQIRLFAITAGAGK